jgi:hypothetical protein
MCPTLSVSVLGLETYTYAPLLPYHGTFLHCVVRSEVITLPSWILWEFQVQTWMTNTLQNCSIATIPLVRTDTAHLINTLVGSHLHACYKLAVLKYMIQDCKQQMSSIIKVFVLAFHYDVFF